MHPNPVCMGLSLLLRVLEVWGIGGRPYAPVAESRGLVVACSAVPSCLCRFVLYAATCAAGRTVPELGGTVRYPASGVCPGIRQTDVLARGGTKTVHSACGVCHGMHNPVHPSPRCLSDRTAVGELREFHDSWLFSRVLRGRSLQFRAPADNLPTETLEFRGC